ncbi:MAG: hypothetical protein LBE31_02670 [Deltaproteobacteria bacterium]|jgi:hypothetical protein|nr:hypothetical protein [Deltaproteobacteria bacterium]
MIKTNASDDWIHQVRIELYEKTKNMSNKELIEFLEKMERKQLNNMV